jgi:Calcineurin-like phosphoesterase superfamily domain
MRIAAIADVHGNLKALEAVLAHIDTYSPDIIVNLGDLVSGPFDPAGSADAQIGMDCHTIAGNHERQLLEGATGFSDAFARSRLRKFHLDWMAGLPKFLTFMDGEIFVMEVLLGAIWSIFLKTSALANQYWTLRKQSARGCQASETQVLFCADTPTLPALSKLTVF